MMPTTSAFAGQDGKKTAEFGGICNGRKVMVSLPFCQPQDREQQLSSGKGQEDVIFSAVDDGVQPSRRSSLRTPHPKRRP